MLIALLQRHGIHLRVPGLSTSWGFMQLSMLLVCIVGVSNVYFMSFVSTYIVSGPITYICTHVVRAVWAGFLSAPLL